MSAGRGEHRSRLWVPMLIAAVVVLALTACSAAAPPAAPLGPLSSGPAGAPVVSVAGNRLVDQRGDTLALRGVNRSGTQYSCTTGPSAFDGPTDQRSIDAMRSWGITAVRVSLNEQCWLGLNGLPKDVSAEDHRRAVVDFVDRLTADGLVVIVDLHWNAPGGSRALGQQTMADRDHAPDFWRSVATSFAPNRGVLFDLYNEPYPDGNRDSDAAWRCVRDGGDCPGVGFTAAGMQELVDAVRSTGAVNPILVAGPQWAGSVTRWQEFAPDDPQHQLVASIHIYGPPPNDTACTAPACWDATIAPLAAQVPVLLGEIGDMDCTSQVIDPLTAWADARGIGYLAWAWVTSDCAREPALISDYNGTPTRYGVGLRDHLLRE